LTRLGGEAVEMGGSIQHLHPIARGERHLEENATYYVGGGVSLAFGSTVLRKRAGDGVVELATTVALESTNRAIELGGDPNKKVRKSAKSIGLQS
jgi:hypothetical protein